MERFNLQIPRGGVMDSLPLVLFLSNGSNCLQPKEKEICAGPNEINPKINPQTLRDCKH